MIFQLEQANLLYDYLRKSHVWFFFSHPRQPLSPVALAFPIPSPPWVFPLSYLLPATPAPRCVVSAWSHPGTPHPPSSALTDVPVGTRTHACTHTGRKRSSYACYLVDLILTCSHFSGTYRLLHNPRYIVTLGCERTRVPCFPQR